MDKKFSPIHLVATVLIFASISCGLFSRAAGRDEPRAEQARLEITRQWASSARASSEYDNPDWSAGQATGAPDTLECGDKPTAWASYGDTSVEWLEVGYDTPLTPTQINIYESHTPTQVVRVEVLDTQGNYHQVYTAEPRMAAECPYVLSVPVQGAEYQASGVKITVDQSQLELPWDEIDAVELVGYADNTAAGSEQEPDAAREEQPAQAPESPASEGPLIELPVANPSQPASFDLSYSGCNEDGQEPGTEVEVSVHDDRIDLRLWGTHGKYALITLPRNLEDDFSDELVPFALEGRVPSAAGLYIRSVWWYGEKGSVSTHYNADGTLSGVAEFTGTRKNGCEFKVKAEFEHAVLRE
jgi:hypothetical protein